MQGHRFQKGGGRGYKGITKKQLGPSAELKTEKFLQEWFGNANAGAEYAIELVHVLFKGTLQKQWGRFTRGELMLMLEGMRDRDLVAASAGHGFLNEIEYFPSSWRGGQKMERGKKRFHFKNQSVVGSRGSVSGDMGSCLLEVRPFRRGDDERMGSKAD